MLRRHRLIEQFLVQIMGMSWTEVHEEAEKLEHAVSERLIDRMDEMLGRPAVDPHGDPIPDPDGTVNRIRYDTLLTCPLHTAVRVQRVSDQDPEFLRFVERHDLRPGQVIEVEERERRGRQRAAARREEPAVYDRRARRVEGAGPGRGRGGADADAGAPGARPDAAPAPAPAPAQPADSPFAIEDNSFLVEEAFNQERGVFQNIFGAARTGGQWAATLHPGVARAVADAPALVHPVVRRRRQRIRGRRHADQLPISGAGGGAGPPGVLAAREPRASDRQRRRRAGERLGTGCR